MTLYYSVSKYCLFSDGRLSLLGRALDFNDVDNLWLGDCMVEDLKDDFDGGLSVEIGDRICFIDPKFVRDCSALTNARRDRLSKGTT